MDSDFVFEETYPGESQEGIDATSYGNAYFPREWVLKTFPINGNWFHMTSGMNQNVYLLRAKTPVRVAGRTLQMVKLVPLSYALRRWFASKLRKV